MDAITAKEALNLLRLSPRGFIDVRSPGEFHKSGVPGFHNIPILDDLEREQVGLTYSHCGQPAAIALGESLVLPQRTERVQAWQRIAQDSPHGFGVVTCWRGGLRSQYAARWLREAGKGVARVAGGYQALRRQLLTVLDELPGLLVLSGLTGSGKTVLLGQAEMPKIDLEKFGNHRGSAFGGALDSEQPYQGWFENRIALELSRGCGTYLVEDESATLGELYLPIGLKEKMRFSPVVILEAPLENRVASVHAEYVSGPLQSGFAANRLCDVLESSLLRLRKRLGGEMTERVQRDLVDAFLPGNVSDPESHSRWIRALLVEYYDKAYRHAFERQQREVLFRGNQTECLGWLAAFGK